MAQWLTAEAAKRMGVSSYPTATEFRYHVKTCFAAPTDSQVRRATCSFFLCSSFQIFDGARSVVRFACYFSALFHDITKEILKCWRILGAELGECISVYLVFCISPHQKEREKHETMSFYLPFPLFLVFCTSPGLGRSASSRDRKQPNPRVNLKPYPLLMSPQQ